METISLKEFKALVGKNGWSQQQSISVFDVFNSDKENDVEVWGCVSVKSRLGDITVEYTAGYTYDKSDPNTIDLHPEGTDQNYYVNTNIINAGKSVNPQSLKVIIPDKFSVVDLATLAFSNVKTQNLTEVNTQKLLEKIGEELTIKCDSEFHSDDAALLTVKPTPDHILCIRSLHKKNRDMKACYTEAEMFEFFGFSEDAKTLYHELNLDYMSYAYT